MTKQKLLLVDGNSIAFRAFYAVQNIESFKNKNGLHTNAILFFHNMVESVLKKEKPTHVLIAFDAGKTTFRHAFYEDYKAGRAKTPGEFKEQMPYIRELITALGMKHYELADYEADDIIGTMARRHAAAGCEVVVLSGDKDLTQLADEHTRVEVTTRGVSELVTYTPAFIQEKYGLEPLQIIDMKALAGDKSDNIPGVTKVGEKTAIKLLTEYTSVEGVYDHIDELKKSKMKENLIQDRELAFLSKKLATINVEAPIEVAFDECVYQGKQLDLLIPFFQEMEFKSLLAKLDPQETAERSEPMKEVTYKQVKEFPIELAEKDLTLVVEMVEPNYHQAEIVGLAFASEEMIYVAESVADLLADQNFQTWAQSPTTKKIVYDAKAAIVALRRFQTDLNAVDMDVLLAAYVLDTNDHGADLAGIAEHYGLTDLQADEVVYGKGAKLAIPEKAVLDEHLARKAFMLRQLDPLLTKQLAEKEQTALFREIELPLTEVLAEMEISGIRVESARLEAMKSEFAIRLKEIEEAIYALAGKEFNINSPKQLGIILFEDMGLPVIKKTKTGYSTAVDVLEQLREQAPIVEHILTYRQIAKIQSTYVEGLLKVIQPADQKIHTRYVQTLTQTGRLSSVDPNLQNIPVRLEEGRKIRQAFVPRAENWSLFSSDYSQIELRVLADISGDPHLQQAFQEGQDIHASTAMRVFGIESAAEVTPNMRRQAKAVNFGIVYGISDYGLSQNLGITRKEAQQFIDTYFEKYPGVQTYMQEVVREAKDKGYVATLFQRRRYLPDINARNFNLRTFAERTAINTPIQGTAADILKIAMIQVAKRLKQSDLQATMLLQVHDELVFEAPNEELPALEALVKEAMEEAVTLKVPLKVDSSAGSTWYDAK